jgi:hypothetical protein
MRRLILLVFPILLALPSEHVFANEYVPGPGGPPTVNPSDAERATWGTGTTETPTSPSTPDPSVAAAAAEADSAISQLTPDAKDCGEKGKSAKLACATLSALTGLGSTEGALLESILMSQLPALIGQMTAGGKSAAQQCKIQADINKLMTVVSTLKTGACLMTMNSCRKQCGSDISTTEAKVKQLEIDVKTNAALAEQLTTARRTLTQVRRVENQCGGYKTNMAMMIAQAGLGIVNTLKSNKCADDFSDPGAVVGIPTATPISLTGSNVDCSNPQFASTNMYCICKSTPNDSMCAGFQNPNGGGPGGAGVGSVSQTTPGLSSGEANDGDLVDQSLIDPSSKKSGSYGVEGGGGSGGLGGGSGGGLLGGGDGEGGGGSGLDKNVITGTSGGGGGVSPLTAGGGGGGGKAGGGSGGGGSGGGGGFDFKKYLPKSLFKNRGLAGMSVPSTDGVTGPMGPTLWEKVTNRYQVKKSSLIQDK